MKGSAGNHRLGRLCHNAFEALDIVSRRTKRLKEVTPFVAAKPHCDYTSRVMSKTLSGKLDAGALRVALLVSRFNEFITTRMLAGARDALMQHGATDENITEAWVPGAWELPLAAKSLAESGRFDAVVCLGCVIRGETSHHLYVGGEAAKGLAQVALQTGVPIGFGVLTTDTLEQAIERAGAKGGNKGADAALAAVEMANLLREIGSKNRTAR